MNLPQLSEETVENALDFAREKKDKFASHPAYKTELENVNKTITELETYLAAIRAQKGKGK